jgi:hypothetical protein
LSCQRCGNASFIGKVAAQLPGQFLQGFVIEID